MKQTRKQTRKQESSLTSFSMVPAVRSQYRKGTNALYSYVCAALVICSTLRGLVASLKLPPGLLYAIASRSPQGQEVRNGGCYRVVVDFMVACGQVWCPAAKVVVECRIQGPPVPASSHAPPITD